MWSVEAQLEGGLKRKPYTVPRAAQWRSNSGVSCRQLDLIRDVYACRVVRDMNEINPHTFKSLKKLQES
jgi:hypothetical protein